MHIVGFYLNAITDKKYNIHIIICLSSIRKKPYTTHERYKIDSTFLKAETVILGDNVPYIPKQCEVLDIDIKSEYYNSIIY